MDVVGVFSVTFVSAFAGGTARDILINRRPSFRVEHSQDIWLILALVLAPPIAALVGICCITGLRLLAVAYQWRIPSWPPER